MNARQYRKIKPRTSDYTRKIVKAAIYVVDNECKNLDGTPLSGDARWNLIGMVSTNMALGANVTRRKNVVTGMVSGVLLAVSINQIQKAIKELRTES